MLYIEYPTTRDNINKKKSRNVQSIDSDRQYEPNEERLGTLILTGHSIDLVSDLGELRELPFRFSAT